MHRLPPAFESSEDEHPGVAHQKLVHKSLLAFHQLVGEPCIPLLKHVALCLKLFNFFGQVRNLGAGQPHIFLRGRSHHP